jgi:hypothetical protein
VSVFVLRYYVSICTWVLVKLVNCVPAGSRISAASSTCNASPSLQELKHDSFAGEKSVMVLRDLKADLLLLKGALSSGKVVVLRAE